MHPHDVDESASATLNITQTAPSILRARGLGLKNDREHHVASLREWSWRTSPPDYRWDYQKKNRADNNRTTHRDCATTATPVDGVCRSRGAVIRNEKIACTR